MERLVDLNPTAMNANPAPALGLAGNGPNAVAQEGGAPPAHADANAGVNTSANAVATGSSAMLRQIDLDLWQTDTLTPQPMSGAGTAIGAYPTLSPEPARLSSPSSTQPISTAPAEPAAPAETVSAEALWQEVRRLLAGVGEHELARRVRVLWNPRLRTTAGLANYRHWTISLNPRIATFGPAEVHRTLRHELAHLLARHRCGRRRIQPHGDEWRQACRDLGLGGEKRCHDLPLPRRQVARRILYRCRHCHAEVWRVRPFRRAVACLKCCREHNRGHYHERYRLERDRDTPEPR